MGAAPIYAAALGVGVGVAAAFFFDSAAVLAGACLLAAFALLLYSRQAVALVAVVALATLALGLVRTELFLYYEAQDTLLEFSGREVEVEGRVANDPERRNTTLHAHVAVESVNDAPARGTLLVLLPRDAQVRYGDTLVVSGRMEEPQAFETETGRLFDYPSYLRARGISATLPFAELLKRTPGPWSLPGALYSLKHTFTGSLERLFTEPRASLLEGLLLGERRGLPEELTDAFIAAGLIHVVVLSGYNISIVADGVLRSLAFLPRALSFLTGGTAILLFVVMIGGGATAVRALIMGLIAVAARYFGRTALALRALAVAALLMVLWNPPALLFDPSFILSVLATFGLITLSPWVEEKLPVFLTAVPHVRSIAASTIAVQLFVLPALLYMTGLLSVFALPANVLVLPAVPLAMSFGFAAALLGLVHPYLALPALAATDLILNFMLAVAQATHALPYSSALVAEFPLWMALAAYVPLTLFALRCYHVGGSEENTSGRGSHDNTRSA